MTRKNRGTGKTNNNNNNNAELCRDFLNDTCKFGNQCKYTHNFVLRAAAQQQRQNASNSNIGEIIPQQSNTRSENISQTSIGNAKAGPSVIKSIEKVNAPCRGWQAGICTWGAKCKYQHLPKASSSTSQGPNPVHATSQSNMATNNINNNGTRGVVPVTIEKQNRSQRRRNQKGKGTEHINTSTSTTASVSLGASSNARAEDVDSAKNTQKADKYNGEQEPAVHHAETMDRVRVALEQARKAVLADASQAQEQIEEVNYSMVPHAKLEAEERKRSEAAREEMERRLAKQREEIAKFVAAQRQARELADAELARRAQEQEAERIRVEAERAAEEAISIARARAQVEARIAEERAAEEARRVARERAQEEARIAKERAAEEARRVARERAQEEARIAKERAAAQRRERKLRLQREKEEALERERIARRRKQEEEWAKEAARTIQKVIMSSFVRYEAGLNIQHVICGFEASQVMVKNLPTNAKRSEVIELFTQQGIEEEDLAILRTEFVDGRQQVTILGKAIDVETVALGLDGIEFRDNTLDFAVCERRSDDIRGMGTAKVQTFHLRISWNKPFQTMLATFHDLETFQVLNKVRSVHNRQIGGHRIHAEYQGTGDMEDNAKTLKISQIPMNITIAEVRTFLGTPHVRIDDNSSYTSDQIFRQVNTHIRTLPVSTLRSFERDPNSKFNDESAKAIFGSWEDAKTVRDNLNKRRGLPTTFPPLRLFLSDPYRFILTLEENQYNAQKSQWTELARSKDKGTNVQIKPIERGNGKKVIISLFGNDKKLVGALKVRIENLARGEKLDATYWHPQFGARNGQRFINELYNSTGAYTNYDGKRRCISVHGTAAALESAKSKIKEEVVRLTEEEWNIPLQRRALGYFIREGLAKMQGLLGEENVSLMVPTSQLVLRGADLEEARHHLKQLMADFEYHSAGLSIRASNSDEVLCPICYDSVSQPVEISCGHVYCSSCLRHYVLSTLENHTFPLKCMGDEANCNSPLTISLIQRFLPAQRFEQLLEAAFIDHIERNPEEYKYCTTPDCSQVYHVTVLPNELQCPSCFSEVCTACHEESHTGMTCAEKRLQRDPAEQERLNEVWATDNGVKRCPSCRIWLEKTEGCNHMTCKCGKHICWVCMGIFESDQIYPHMSEVHGSYYVDPNPRPLNATVQNQAGNAGPDIVQIVGGHEAVAAQMAEYRRFERQQQPLPQALPVRQEYREPVPHVNAQLLLDRIRREREAEIRRQAIARHQEEQARRQREDLLRRAEDVERLRRQREEQMRRIRAEDAQLLSQRLEQERRRRAEKDSKWCVIM